MGGRGRGGEAKVGAPLGGRPFREGRAEGGEGRRGVGGPGGMGGRGALKGRSVPRREGEGEGKGGAPSGPAGRRG